MINENIFVLILGQGRSGTSALTGFLNLVPWLNIASESNLPAFQDDGSRILALKKEFFLRVPYEYNGNKFLAVHGDEFDFETYVKLISNKVLLIHDRFEILKLVFIFRNPIDNIASIYLRRKTSGKEKYADFTIERTIELWIKSTSVLLGLLDFFEGSISVDFYDFLKYTKIKKNLIEYVGGKWDIKYERPKVNAGIYGVSSLNMKKTIYNSKNKKSCIITAREEIREILASNKYYKKVIGRIPCRNYTKDIFGE